MSPGRIVFISPLHFGIAHVHHFYEFRLTHPDTAVTVAIFRSLFQFAYTTLFGWFAAFVYLRTGSLPAVILIHSFCNWCGLPRLWGRVEAGVPIGPPLVRAKDDTEGSQFQVADGRLDISWTVAYYVLLVAGAVGFYYLLWPLTESSLALASFYF
jgi:prenyl protein peptidase